MGFYSAQLDANGVVKAVVDSKEQIVGDNIIQINGYSTDICGKKYNAETQQFEEIPLTQEQLDEIAIKAEIEKIRAERDADLRAEAIANLTAGGKISAITE